MSYNRYNTTRVEICRSTALFPCGSDLFGIPTGVIDPVQPLLVVACHEFLSILQPVVLHQVLPQWACEFEHWHRQLERGDRHNTVSLSAAAVLRKRAWWEDGREEKPWRMRGTPLACGSLTPGSGNMVQMPCVLQAQLTTHFYQTRHFRHGKLKTHQ